MALPKDGVIVLTGGSSGLGRATGNLYPGVIGKALAESHANRAATLTARRRRMPLRRSGRADEFGDIVAWLGWDLSRFVTAAASRIDGGLPGVV